MSRLGQATAAAALIALLLLAPGGARAADSEAVGCVRRLALGRASPNQRTFQPHPLSQAPLRPCWR